MIATRRSHPPEAQSDPSNDSTSIKSPKQKRKLVVFKGRQAAPPMELRYRRRTPRQEAKLARLEEIRQSREHLGDPTPLPTTVQGAFHWDLADQVNALTDARLKKPQRSFMLRMLALCSLPRIDPGDESVYIRTNGPFELVMSRGGRALLPYGNLPRLLLAWICTDTVRTKSRRLELGASLSEFMDRLDIQSTDSGGRYGVRTRLQKQMIRLFSASISLSETHERGARGVNAPIVDTYDLWWDNNEPRQAGLWNRGYRPDPCGNTR